MESVLYLKNAIISLSMSNEEFSQRCPTWVQWKLIEGAVEILKPFRESTIVWSHEKIPTMNTVSERLYTMNTYLEDFIKNKENCKYGVGFARKLMSFVEDRFPNCGTDKTEQTSANYLDPRYRGLHLHLFNKFEETKNYLEQVTKDRNLDGGKEFENNKLQASPISSKDLSPTSRLRQKMRKVTSNNIQEQKIVKGIQTCK